MRILIPLLVLPVLLAACDRPESGVRQTGGDSSRSGATMAAGAASEAAMERATMRAQDELAAFERIARTPLPNQTGFAVRAGLPHPGGVEHVWLTNPVFSGDTVTGTVESAALHIPGVQPGQVLMVERRTISDWMFLQDGRSQGGYTERVLRDTSRARR